MVNEHDESFSEQDFPPLDEDPGFEKIGGPGYDPDPGMGEMPVAEELQESVLEPESVSPVDVSSVESEGVLFLPEDDPLLEPLPRKSLGSQPAPLKYVPRRLRHLVSEPQQPVYKDPSGRNRPKG